MRARIVSSILFIVLIRFAWGQESQFSQFYSTPQYLNPAFAGDVRYVKVGTSSRIIPLTSGSTILNNLLTLNYKLKDQKSGLGFIFFDHTESLRHLKTQLNYGYSFRLKEALWVKPGLGISFNERSTVTTSLLFPDQFDDYGPTGDPTNESSLTDRSYFFGISSGIILYNKIFWLSFSGDYLNQPVETFASTTTKYPMKLNFLGGLLIPLNKTSSKRRFSKLGGLSPYTTLNPIVALSYQNRYFEADAGITFNHKPVFAGINYRYQFDYRESDTKYAYEAVVAMLGYRQESFSITYSYDITISDYVYNRNGSHELSLIVYFTNWRPGYNQGTLVPLPNQLFY